MSSNTLQTVSKENRLEKYVKMALKRGWNLYSSGYLSGISPPKWAAIADTMKYTSTYKELKYNNIVYKCVDKMFYNFHIMMFGTRCDKGVQGEEGIIKCPCELTPEEFEEYKQSSFAERPEYMYH